MRCKCLRSFIFFLAIAFFCESAVYAAENGHKAGASSSSSGTIAIKLADDAVKTDDKSLAEPDRTKAVAPTQAKRELSAPARAISGEVSDQTAPQPEQISVVQPKKAEEPLRPIPEVSDSGPVSVEAASFKGVIPGSSTKQDVEKAWGKPKKEVNENEALVQLYSVEPFNRVEVSYAAGKVASVVVRFERSFPADGVAKQLDLSKIRPVLISNELGEPLGVSYPERGVLFAFEPSKTPGKPSMMVSQIVLEPIAAEPFILRAETTLESNCEWSRRDLEQALSLEADSARAHWLYGRVLAAMETYEKASEEAGAAVKLDPSDPQYRVTLAQILAQSGRFNEGIEEAGRAVSLSQKRLHIKAKALCLIGDLTASGPKPDYRKAISFHGQAIQTADPLSNSPHPAIRISAKEVLIDAHLGAAHDIAWGDWKEKGKAVVRWLDRALIVAEDLVKNDDGSRENILRVHVRTMAAYVGVRGEIDPEPTVKAIVSTGDALIAATRDPIHKTQLQRDMGMALYDAVQICQMRSDTVGALKYGRQATEYLTKANEVAKSQTSSYLIGRLYFRLGAIQAITDKDHRAAVVWFDKAVPLLEAATTGEAAAELGRHGEAFVSMGVSYWEAGRQEKAVSLTEKGVKLMEQAARQGKLEKAALNVPYNNLAAMHRKLGSNDTADRLQEMAERLKKETLK